MPRSIYAAAAFALTLTVPATAQDFRPPEGPDTEIKQSYSPFAGQDFPQNA